MHQLQVELTDQLYKQAKLRAVEAGFKSVEAYAAGVLADDLAADTESLDHLFTPERLALIDKAEGQIKAGQCRSAREADVELARRRTEWLQNNPA
jgi:hypothetical protein